jgi:GntR family transcriptional regulator, colanic acid and biofilm gene transcriptional regulator
MPAPAATEMTLDLAEPPARDGALAPLQSVPRGSTLGDEAYAQVRHALMSGRLQPGQQITLRGLAQALGISLTPAREALARLVAEGVLQSGPHRTIAVPRLTLAEYQECLKIRLALEPMAAAQAVTRLSKNDVAQLRAIHEALVAAHRAERYADVLQYNERFHFGLYAKSDMPTLMQILESLWLRVGPTLNLVHRRTTSRQVWRGDANHREILAGLAKRDADRVAEAVRTDLVQGGERVMRILGTMPSQP